MPPTFDVTTAPLSAEIVQQTRARYSRLELGYRWLWLPLVLLSLFAGYEAFNLFLANAKSFYMGILTGVLTVLALLSALHTVGFYVNSGHRTFSPLPPRKCQPALLLARCHPELEAYRLAVAAERHFTIGDLEAMQSHVAEKDFMKEKKQAEDVYRAACEALHKLN